MATINNFCPTCNRFFLEPNKHKCRKQIMHSRQGTHGLKIQEKTSAAAALKEVKSLHCLAAVECDEPRNDQESDGSLKLGPSYLGLLDEMCIDEVTSTRSEDPRAALEKLLTSNLSGEYCLGY